MNKHVLLIDDDPAILDAITVALEDEGFIVTKIDKKDDLQKIGLYTQYKPNIIVLDTFLSGVDGRTIAKKLKQTKKTSHIPIIMMSAVSEICSSARRSGADAFLPKPFDLNDLINTIDTFIHIDDFS